MEDLSLSTAPARYVRRAIRNQHWNHPTAGVAPGYVQANLAIVPEHT